MRKQILILAMMVLLVGVVSADRSLMNVVNINLPSNVVAGSQIEANFSFDYYYGGDNKDNSPLIIKLDISSIEDYYWCNGADFDKNGVVDASDYITIKRNNGNFNGVSLSLFLSEFGNSNCSENYPVWKGDFAISGKLEKRWFFNMLTETVEFNCSEEYNQVIEHPLDAQSVIAPNGTFYCYNEAGDLKLNENDKVFLDITSNPALYPGKYNLSATMFYLTDERAPFVNITNKDVFDLYYREIDSVEILATISDGSGIKNFPWGMAFLGYNNLTFPFTHKSSGIYHFSRNTPVDIAEGDYPLYVFAEDEYNNTGNDSVTLKIDRTAPNITLIQPNNESIYGVNDSLIIEVGVSDTRAGVDNSSVVYRISEIVNGSFCPDSGVLFGSYSCYNSGWVADWSGGDFKTMINISGSDFVSGSYWLEAGACDILGNCGVL